MMLDEILPEAFALVREAAWRTIGQRHFDVQLMAALALHNGKVAEQKTGKEKPSPQFLRCILMHSRVMERILSPSTIIWHAVTQGGWDRFFISWA